MSSLYHDLLQAYKSVVRGMYKSNARCLELEREKNGLLDRISNESTQAIIPGDSHPKVVQLERKLQEVKEERVELYRVQGVNAQRLLSLNEALKEREAECSKLRDALKNKEHQELEIRSELDRWKELVEEKEVALRYMQEELTKLQLELLVPKL
jgi:chromosome segregation ATPase